MNSALHYKIYKEGMNKQVIIKYIEPIKLFGVYYTTVDHVWGD